MATVHDSLYVFYSTGLRDTTPRSKRVATLNIKRVLAVLTIFYVSYYKYDTLWDDKN